MKVEYKLERFGEHYGNKDIKTSPLKHDFNGFLREVEIKLGEFDRLFRQMSVGNPAIEIPMLNNSSSNLFKAIRPRYEIVKRKVIRKREHYEKFTDDEKIEFQRLLCELEYCCSCILHIDTVARDVYPHPFVVLQLPLSDWARDGIWSVSYDQYRFKIIINVGDYNLNTDSFERLSILV